MPESKAVFGVALYDYGEDEAQEVTREELLALHAFELITFNASAPGRFYIRMDREQAVKRFLKQWRMGRGS